MMRQEMNGRVTLAIVQRDLQALTDALHDHDKRNCADFKALREDIKSIRDFWLTDHVLMARTDERVSSLEGDVRGLKRENRIWSGLAGLVALGAAALGIQKP